MEFKCSEYQLNYLPTRTIDVRISGQKSRLKYLKNAQQ